jgi:septal ring factor EnvC (AmiA/AmiB activator)
VPEFITVAASSATTEQLLNTILQTLETQHQETITHMATIDEDLDRLFQAITTEIQQVRDGLQQQITDLGTENSGLKDQLQAADDSLASVQQRIEGKTSELEANDPPAQPPA